MQTFKKNFNLLNAKKSENRQVVVINDFSNGIADMIGVASIPFMTVLTNPGIIETNLILNMFQHQK